MAHTEPVVKLLCTSVPLYITDSKIPLILITENSILLAFFYDCTGWFALDMVQKSQRTNFFHDTVYIVFALSQQNNLKKKSVSKECEKKDKNTILSHKLAQWSQKKSNLTNKIHGIIFDTRTV